MLAEYAVGRFAAILTPLMSKRVVATCFEEIAQSRRGSLVQAYLTTMGESTTGTRYPLITEAETKVGRGLDCDVVVDDPLASRVHAVLAQREGDWWIADSKSRNGTYVNGRKIDEARLGDGCKVRIGAVEFRFTLENGVEGDETIETILRQTRMDPLDTGAEQPVADSSEMSRIERLYEFSLALVSAEDHDHVIQKALSLLHEATNASCVSFWWVDEDEKMRPKSALPADQPHPTPSERLTDLVCRQGTAVWLKQERGELKEFASAICVPLVHEDAPLGALHVFAEKNEFTDDQYKFILNFANVMVRALTRARKQAAIKVAHERLVQNSANFDELIGDSEPMLELKNMIRRVAKASGCVLVRGESGAGKELVARALHKSSPRGDRPMLSVNCAAIPRDLMESQLFGHRKGAFTGAESDHQGFFERADSGTLFLDEVGEMTLEGQAKLLRILEGHPFLPVGGAKEITVDVRVIAATNRDLREFVGEGRFREDLYYRLCVFELHAAAVAGAGRRHPQVVALLPRALLQTAWSAGVAVLAASATDVAGVPLARQRAATAERRG